MRSKLPFLIVLALIPLLAAPAWSELQPAGQELRVNRNAESQQRAPVATFDAAGARALVVWENGKNGLRGRLFSRAGAPLSDELGLVANTNIPGLPFTGEVTTHREPAAAFLPSGDFLLAWTEERSHLTVDIFYQRRDVLDRDVVAQRFTAAGEPAGPAYRVNATAAGFQSAPRLLVRQGGVLVVWTSNDRAAGSTAGDGLFGRLVSASGQPAGDELRITDGFASNAAVAGAGDGRFAVAWEAADGGRTGVFVRLFDAAAQPVGGEIRVNSRVAGLQRRPGLSAAGDGWLVVWQGQVGPLTDSRIFGQFLGEAGNLVGANFRVSGDRADTRIAPSVARVPGGFLVVWMDWNDVFPVGLYGVTLDRFGNTTSEEVRINDRQIDAHHRTALAVGAGGDLLMTWEGFASGQRRSGIEARFFRVK